MVASLDSINNPQVSVPPHAPNRPTNCLVATIYSLLHIVTAPFRGLLFIIQKISLLIPGRAEYLLAQKVDRIARMIFGSPIPDLAELLDCFGITGEIDRVHLLLNTLKESSREIISDEEKKTLGFLDIPAEKVNEDDDILRDLLVTSYYYCLVAPFYKRPHGTLQPIFRNGSSLLDRAEEVCRALQKSSIMDLNLESCGLTCLPKQFCVYNLQKLDVSSNHIVSLPAEALSTLQDLDLSDNGIADPPEEVFTLPNLKKLNLSFNKISQFWDGFTISSPLRELNLSDNQIAEFPEALLAISTLEHLSLLANPIRLLPFDLRSHLPSLKKYSPALSEDPASISTGSCLLSDRPYRPPVPIDPKTSLSCRK